MAKRASGRRPRQSAIRGLSSSARGSQKQNKADRPDRVLAIQFFAPRDAGRRRSKLRQLSIPLGSKRSLELSLFPPRSPSPKTRGRPKKPVTRELVVPLKLQTALALLLIVAGLVGSIYFSLQATRADIPPPTNVSTINLPTPQKSIDTVPRGLKRSEPTQLRIPAIGVKTGFVKLGKLKDGTMQVPKEYGIAGWYKYAPTPGQIGPAIVVGHVDSYQGAAVFYRLRELKPGDMVVVYRADKTKVKFKVERIKEFSQSDFPTKEVYGNIRYAGLRLITCSGNFLGPSSGYTHNTVVFAKLVT